MNITDSNTTRRACLDQTKIDIETEITSVSNAIIANETPKGYQIYILRL